MLVIPNKFYFLLSLFPEKVFLRFSLKEGARVPYHDDLQINFLFIIKFYDIFWFTEMLMWGSLNYFLRYNLLKMIVIWKLCKRFFVKLTDNENLK